MDSVFTSNLNLNYPLSTTNGTSKIPVLDEETRCRTYLNYSVAKQHQPMQHLITFEAITHE